VAARLSGRIRQQYPLLSEPQISCTAYKESIRVPSSRPPSVGSPSRRPTRVGTRVSVRPPSCEGPTRGVRPGSRPSEDLLRTAAGSLPPASPRPDALPIRCPGLKREGWHQHETNSQSPGVEFGQDPHALRLRAAVGRARFPRRRESAHPRLRRGRVGCVVSAQRAGMAGRRMTPASPDGRGPGVKGARRASHPARPWR
jgi:hypothetical protein